MDIKGKITGIKYKILLSEDLKVVDINTFNINKVSPFCLVKDGHLSFAVSKWVSPKRTRSYPYERVYNTLNISKKITIIPIIKDEGFDGDRDFLQWDTISLMSLLDVFVIFAYYSKATRNPEYENKITNFQFDNKYVISKIKEIEQYHSSALHWNLNELKNNLHNIVIKTKKNYAKIEDQTGVLLHNKTGIENFKKKIGKDISNFMDFSREKAQKAQSREMLTAQPKESLSTNTKAKITITNYLGGQYFFTVDEILVDKDTVHLVECKHSKTSILPSKGDIKDGLLKMILYSNLCDVEVNGKKMKSHAILNLTSAKISNEIISENHIIEREKFIADNDLKPEIRVFINKLFKEANDNGFVIRIGGKK
ncbi:MAG: hypothetical protein LBI45_06200 [Bacteroidales bacterium]|jgi:hypothetical protein|nr:hypothetical protein [Bacteroidales bacterium]